MPKKKVTKPASAMLKESKYAALKKPARKKGKEVAAGGERKIVFIQSGYELVVCRKSCSKKQKPASRPKVSAVKDNKRNRDEPPPCVKNVWIKKKNQRLR
jgi:hypothetical protein